MRTLSEGYLDQIFPNGKLKPRWAWGTPLHLENVPSPELVCQVLLIWPGVTSPPDHWACTWHLPEDTRSLEPLSFCPPGSLPRPSKSHSVRKAQVTPRARAPPSRSSLGAAVSLYPRPSESPAFLWGSFFSCLTFSVGSKLLEGRFIFECLLAWTQRLIYSRCLINTLWVEGINLLKINGTLQSLQGSDARDVLLLNYKKHNHLS